MCMCYAYVCIVYYDLFHFIQGSVCIKRSNHPSTYLEVDFMLAHSVLLLSPFADLTAHYYHLKASNSSLEILESYIYEVRDNRISH